MSSGPAVIRHPQCGHLVASYEPEWYGCAGHFIGRQRCRFHLHTHVGPFCISTVGDYYNRDGGRETLGAGEQAWYESMVFDARKPDEIDAQRYNDEGTAQDGHKQLVRVYSP